MNVLKITFQALFFLLLVSPVSGQASVGQTISLTGDLFGRSTPDFVSKENIDYVVPSGTSATVLESQTLPSGSTAVRVRVNQVNANRGATTVKPGQETWVYYSKTQPLFNLSEDSSAGYLPPPSQTSTKRYRPPQIRPYEETTPAPSVDPNLAFTSNRYQTEAGYCADCVQPSQTTTERNNRFSLRSIFSFLKKKPRETTTAPRDSVFKAAVANESVTWASFPEITRFSNDPRTLKTISDANRNINNGITEKGYCYRWVKKALFKNYTGGGQYNSQLPGAYARNAVRELQNLGWKNMLNDPRYSRVLKGDYHNAPKGAIIVYSNGSSSDYPGHVEIKESDSRNSSYLSFYKGYNFLNSPRAAELARRGKPLKVIGVMFKPE